MIFASSGRLRALSFLHFLVPRGLCHRDIVSRCRTRRGRRGIYVKYRFAIVPFGFVRTSSPVRESLTRHVAIDAARRKKPEGEKVCEKHTALRHWCVHPPWAPRESTRVRVSPFTRNRTRPYPGKTAARHPRRRIDFRVSRIRGNICYGRAAVDRK